MNTELAILTAILAASGDPVYADQIRRELLQFTGQRHSLADVETALTRLEEKGQLTATLGAREDDAGHKLMSYFLTPKGRNRAQAQ
jgi:DNA-binding PadR family transcriptional regulator